MKKRPPSPDEPSFEEALRQLETIVRKLEGGELSLDESLALFERGQALAGRCGALLDAAELKVKQLTPQGDLAEFPEDT